MLPRLIRTITLLAFAAAPAAAQHHDGDRHASPADKSIRSQRMRLETGVTLDVAQRGPADGYPVLFLHGTSDSWFSFTPMLDELPTQIRAIVPSQRGHGESDRPDCCYLIKDLAADAVALLDALGIARATIVGHSHGSFVAQRVAIEFPERVNRLVLVGSGATPRNPVMLGLNEAVKDLHDPIPVSFVREFQESTLFKAVPPAYLDRVVTESYKLPARVWQDLVAGLVTDIHTSALQRIKAPTFVIWGERDAIFDRASQDALLARLEGARFRVYSDNGHAPHWEDPARFVADLVPFLELPVRAGNDGATPRGEAHSHPAGAAKGPMPLLEGLGDWHFRITTSSPAAQRYFDQGLRLMYAFNHDEALRSFERAVELDPTCALCHWGIAYALGPNINLPMDVAAEPRALTAAREAARIGSGATERERGLISSMLLRYGKPAGAARATRDSAYARAMRDVARQFPEEVDVQVIFADAMLNLRPWNQWTRDGRAQPGTQEVIATLERALQRTPDHAGACHFYVHTVEASETPERALPCAERLPRLMPGAGHVVHMPAHVYLRVGRYEDAARANIAAVEADSRYFAAREVPEGMYPMFYAPHNLHFLWSAYVLSGQHAKAWSAARTLTQRVRIEDARSVASLEGFLVAEILTLVRFGDWDAVLAAPAPPAELRYFTGMWHYARGVARAARGDIAAAAGELERLRALAAQVPDDVIIILNPAPTLLNIASEVLAGRIASHQKQHRAAIAHFRTAARLEDGLTYDEPPPWYHSARNLLGEALLDAGRPGEAEAAFREDLRFVRETGWSLSGLERALRAQGKKREAAEVAKRLENAWQHADGPVHRGRWSQ